MRHSRQLNEDARNIAVITGSALVAVVATLALVNGAPASRSHPVPAASPWPESYTLKQPLAGTNQLYGSVWTRDGAVHRGFLRWDRNEGSWGDLLDVSKLDRGFRGLSGIRFGHVDRIQPVGSSQAIFHLRSGQTIGMEGESTDLGLGMRSLVVTGANGDPTTLEWREIRRVDFEAAPRHVRPAAGRLYGTLSTGRGAEFTGYITWDVDEIHSTDFLDGEADGRDYQIPFGAISEIEQYGPVGAHVTLHTGERITLFGTNDVDRSNRGITVSDPGLGQVKVPWDYLGSVRFHGARRDQSRSDFDGGRPLRGTVITTSGDALSGDIRWDRDEYSSWEMLNGTSAGIEFDVEFSRIERIVKNDAGSTVILRDGRAYDLQGSNDVDSGNRDILVTTGGSEYVVAWEEFRELRLHR
ncbi:MAG: hypothetical protein OXI83_09110 [Gemmatimonadota bacterium]|nr:hypothetical protein [Gemmatimonadota bacterium]